MGAVVQVVVSPNCVYRMFQSVGDEAPSAAPSNYGEYESIDWMRDTNIDRQNKQHIAGLVRPRRSKDSVFTPFGRGQTFSLPSLECSIECRGGST